MRDSLLKMTEESFSSDPLVLIDPRAATFVTLPASSKYFLPFLARERAAAEVARELDVDVGSVGYRIRQMLALKLVRCTRRQPRAGRPVQYYRSTADRVFAPIEQTPVATVSELFRRGRTDSHDALDDSVERAWLRMGRDQGWGTVLYRPGPGDAVNRDFVPRNLMARNDFWEAVLADTAPAVWDQHTSVRLPTGAAKALQRELAALIRRYATLGSDSDDEYLVRLAMAPHRR